LRWNGLKEHDERSDLVIDDFPNTGPIVEELGPEFEVIRDLVLNKGRVARYRNGVYMFVPQCGSWVHTRSYEAGRYIADLLEMRNVTVNYMTAVDMYISYAEMIALGCNCMPRSLCISSWRSMVSFIDPKDHSKGISLSPVHKVVKFEGGRNPLKRSTGLCISPIRITTMSSRVRSFKPSRGETSLSNVMAPHDLKLIRWVIGNALLDPVDRPRALYLYGAGGEGKSATINTLLAHLPGAVHPLSRDYVGGHHTMSVEDLSAAMSSRFISYGDVVLTKSRINASFWKTITGGDTIKVASGQGRIVCTAMFASNHLWYPSSSLTKRWFSRRTIVVPLTAPHADASPPPESFSDPDIHDFVMNCVYERMTNHDIPLPISTVLLTIFGYRISVATRGIRVCANSNFVGCVAGTWSLSLAGQLEYDLLLDLVSAASPTLVGKAMGVSYIRDITPCEVKPRTI